MLVADQVVEKGVVLGMRSVFQKHVSYCYVNPEKRTFSKTIEMKSKVRDTITEKPRGNGKLEARKTVNSTVTMSAELT